MAKNRSKKSQFKNFLLLIAACFLVLFIFGSYLFYTKIGIVNDYSTPEIEEILNSRFDFYSSELRKLAEEYEIQKNQINLLLNVTGVTNLLKRKPHSEHNIEIYLFEENFCSTMFFLIPLVLLLVFLSFFVNEHLINPIKERLEVLEKTSEAKKLEPVETTSEKEKIEETNTL